MVPQSQLEESANEPCAGVGEGSKISPLRRRYCSKSPLLEVFFLDIAFIIASDRLKKALTKKKDRHTDITQISADLEVGWVLFPDTLNAVIARRSPQKRVPNQAPRFP